MSTIPCPHCRKSIKFSAPEPASGSDNMLGTRELRAVRDMLQNHQPGRHTISEIHAFYELHRSGFGWPPLSKNALARALRQYGATPWRNAQGRGWDLPRLERDHPVAKPAPSVREEEAEQDYRATVARSGRLERGDTDDLPLTVG